MSARAAVVAESRRVLAERARTFRVAALLLPRAARDDAAVVYAFCRMVDDVADEGADAASAAAALDLLRAEVAGAAPARPLVAELRATAARLDLPLASALELIEGVRSDLRDVRVGDADALLRYAYRVASTVGLMMCAVLRVRAREALPHAVDLGIAMQLTNICRDVAEDAERGRVYLPADRLRAAGVEPEDVVRGAAASREGVGVVVAQVLELADRYYRSADDGMRDLPWRVRPAILVASRVYRAIGLRLRARGCDALAGRAVVPAHEKAVRAAAAALESLRPRFLGLGRRGRHDRALHSALQGLPGAHS